VSQNKKSLKSEILTTKEKRTQRMSLDGKVFAITGTLSTPRSNLIKWIEERGGVFSQSVTKKVTHLIVSDPNITSTKIQKARKDGTAVISEDQLRAMDDGREIVPIVLPPKAPKKVQTSLTSSTSSESGEKKRLSGMTIALTGRLSKSKEEYAAIIAQNGGIFSPTVTKKVTHVIAKDADAASDKLDKARKNGIKVVEESFLDGLTGTVATIGKIQKTGKEAPPAVLLAKKFDPEKTDPNGWWVSEKLDGVRSYWNGKRFLSRLGNEFFPPPWYCEALPKDHCLDGELFVGRKKFRETVSIVKSHEASNRWKDVTFMVFDIPSSGDKPFEERMQMLQEICSDLPYVKIVEQIKFDKNQGPSMNDLLKEVETLGAEGLMLRQPGSKYIGKRSDTLLKIKSFTDEEAKVIGYATEGKGRHKGTTGSLQVVNRAGVKFKVGSGLTDSDRANPPPIGSIITFRYQELSDTSGKPRFPTFVGLAIDKEFP
jgi:BRCT domain type II-containing protein